MDTIQLPDGHPVDLISEDDRQWFDDRPGRFFRLRFATDGDGYPDYPSPEGSPLILVFCPTDGIRLRMSCPTAPFGHEEGWRHTAIAAVAKSDTDNDDADLSHIFGWLAENMMGRRVQYADGTSKSMGPMVRLQLALYEQCRKRGWRLTRQEYDRAIKRRRR